MSTWLRRVLGGIACIIGVLALSMGIAHADEKDQGRKLGVQVTVDAKAKPKDSAVKATVPRARGRRYGPPSARRW